MTNVRRPIHLHSRPTSLALASSTRQTARGSCSPKPLSPRDDSLPSQILPYLFVGNQGQTNTDTLNRLNISYILSLGLSPLISTQPAPATAAATSPSLASATSTKTTTTTTVSAKQTTTTTTTTTPTKTITISTTTTTTAPVATHHISNANANINTATTSTTTITTTPCPRAASDSRENENQEATKAVRTIKCKCINIADSCEQSLAKFFDEAHQFIDEARKKKCNILVHCLAGISRSPTIAIAYLMRVNSLPLQDAYNLVKKCRPQTDPNIGFLGQLMSFEKTLAERTNKQLDLTENSATKESQNGIVKHVLV